MANKAKGGLNIRGRVTSNFPVLARFIQIKGLRISGSLGFRSEGPLIAPLIDLRA